MDPWGSTVAEQAPTDTFFEDNFKPTVGQTLPDSQQYLETLERKLKAIKNDPNILKQLQEKREACMLELLQTETKLQEVQELEVPIKSNQIIRSILPEKQALNRGEIVELVR